MDGILQKIMLLIFSIYFFIFDKLCITTFFLMLKMIFQSTILIHDNIKEIVHFTFQFHLIKSQLQLLHLNF